MGQAAGHESNPLAGQLLAGAAAQQKIEDRLPLAMTKGCVSRDEIISACAAEACGPSPDQSMPRLAPATQKPAMVKKCARAPFVDHETVASPLANDAGCGFSALGGHEL